MLNPEVKILCRPGGKCTYSVVIAGQQGSKVWLQAVELFLFQVASAQTA
jgi:hypothetical protein